MILENAESLMKLIDSHCHLDFEQFAQDHQQVIANATNAGVTGFVIPGVQASKWQSLIEFCQANQNCHFALGIHPYFLPNYAAGDIEKLSELLAQNKAVAVGECGIDASIENIDLQQQIFEQHIVLANQFAKPMILHHRKSHHLILQSFKAIRPRFGGVVHAFSGSLQDAEKYLALGFKLGVGGTITYDRAKKTRDVIKQVPLEHLLLETDSPDMPVSGQQGKRNEPMYLSKVLEVLSDLKGLDKAQVAEQTYLNTQRLFNL